MWESIVAAVFVAILTGSALNQLDWPRWEKTVAKYDPLMFLPYWGFFAPDPGFAGNHVVYRDRVADDWGAWVEVPIPRGHGWSASGTPVASSERPCST
ncbi:hypothetical protein [Cryobacterium soli]|uniref:hypothetical protein n=1 Tax=Cryobacterium soli TaxID=2220095 RepID=UPI000E723268|nr:hypothetical protein [Cryobacterium soli]